MSTWPGEGEGVADEGSADEARRDAVAVGMDEFGETVTRFRALGRVGEQIERDREGVRGLSIRGHRAVGLHVRGTEGCRDLPGESGVALRLR